MILERLYASGVRNLHTLDVRLGPGLNVVTGPNGSGKTAFLEALHFAVRGYSFRSREAADVISNGQDGLEVGGWFVSSAGRHDGYAGVTQGRTMIRRPRAAVRPALTFNEVSVKTLRGLGEHLACVVLGQDDARATRVSADRRRMLMDGFLFHVEPTFAEEWKRFRAALRQRNAALRTGADHRPWDGLFAAHGTRLAELRTHHVDQIRTVLNRSSLECGLDEEVTIAHRRGWPSGVSLRDVLAAHGDRDRAAGYTTVGPHRADLVIRVGDTRRVDQASAGQSKLALIALRHAQLSLLGERSIILLVDDLAAELDAPRTTRSLAALNALCSQVFATFPRADALGSDFVASALFHVKQGMVTRLVRCQP